jgi:hypothetical protein
MYKTAPQANDYALIEKLQKANKVIFTAIIALSILSSINASKIVVLPENLDDIKNILYIGLMILLAIISIVIDYNLLPNAQKTTRWDFFDHSFGTKYIHHMSSEEYYTNTNLDFGTYKMAANLFESCFFTYTISCKMRFKKIMMCCILLAVFIPLIFYGFKNTSLIGIILLQALLSIYFLSGLIRLLIFVNKSEYLFNELIMLFANADLKTNIEKYVGPIIKMYADYETNKAWSYLHVDSKLYNEMNEELSKVWDEMKVKYNIK